MTDTEIDETKALEKIYSAKFETWCEDPIVQNIMARFSNRSREGMRSYGVSMADNNAPFIFWVEQAQEELMDAILYLEKLKEKYKDR